MSISIDSNRRLDCILQYCKELPCQRIADIALPLLSLNEKTAICASIGIGIYQSGVHVSHIATAIRDRKWKDCSKESSQLVLMVALAACSYFYQTAYCVASNGLFLTYRVGQLSVHLWKHEWKQSGLVSLQITHQLIYIGSLYYGTPVWMVLSLVTQASSELIQAYKQGIENKKPEMSVSLLLAAIRLHKASTYLPHDFSWIKAEKTGSSSPSLNAVGASPATKTPNSSMNNEKEIPQTSNNKTESLQPPKDSVKAEVESPLEIESKAKKPSAEELAADPLLKRLAEKVANSKEVKHLSDHPLQDLKSKISDRRVIREGAPGNYHKCGAHFYGHGKGLVKGHNLFFQEKKSDGKQGTELLFKMNHFHRDQLEPVIVELIDISKHPQVNEMLTLTGSEIKGIQVSEKLIGYIDHNTQKARMPLHEISLIGLGSMYVGASPKQPGLYDQVIVRVENDPTIEKFYQILSFLNLQDALEVCTAEDFERVKMGRLFKDLFPTEATPFERTEDFFALPIDKLKELIIKKVPQMADNFSKYLPQMELYEIMLGRYRNRISGLAQKCYEAGGRALIHAFGGEGQFNGEEDEYFDELASVINMGLLSNESRRIYGFSKGGVSPNTWFGNDTWYNWDDESYFKGSADSVFTRLVTEENCRTSMPLSGYSYMEHAGCGIIVSLDSLETGTYQQHDQNRSAGSRRLDDAYLNRPGILEFIQQEQAQFNGDNEVMTKDIPPSMIQSIVFTAQEMRDKFVEYLRVNKMIKKDKKSGQETINGHPLEQFVRYAIHMSEELIGGQPFDRGPGYFNVVNVLPE